MAYLKAISKPEGAGFIVLMDKEQEAVLFSAEQLVVNLRDRGIRLAMLGACEAGRRDAVNPWTGVVPALTRAGIPAVLGMQYTVGDDNAQAFSKRFYAAVVQGQSVDAAMTNGRIAMFNRSDVDERDWGVPVLYLRTVEDVLFPKTGVTEAQSTWDDVVSQARAQSNGVLQAAAGTPGHPGAFVPQLNEPCHRRRRGGRLGQRQVESAVSLGEQLGSGWPRRVAV